LEDTWVKLISRVPAPAYFGVSAVFHYLGPAFAVLLFAHVGVLGVAWLRIASAALVFALCRPWRLITRLAPEQRWLMLGLGAVLAAMNSTFYLAIDRLPLSTVGAIEFLGIIVLAAAGVRSRRNALALGLAVAGVATLTDIRLIGEPIGIALAFVNCALFMLYVILGHRIANNGSSAIEQLGLSMLIAAVVATPFGIGQAATAFGHPGWLLAGVGVGICSSVIPYVTDQLAMARLRRSTFALMLSILPATATVIGLIVLGQVPTVQDVLGVGLVIAAVAIHQQEEKTHGADPVGNDRHEGVQDLPRHDELRGSTLA
jgi:inner membrane transporter RhtA